MKSVLLVGVGLQRLAALISGLASGLALAVRPAGLAGSGVNGAPYTRKMIPMGIYIRPSRFLKVADHPSRRVVGGRAAGRGRGPRGCIFGAGGPGVSTGAGPVSVYRGLRRRRRR